LSSGQHCRSVSVIFVHQAHYRAFTDGFVERAKHYAMGSLFAQDRYLKFSAVSEREGASLAMRGKPLSTSANRNSATPTIALFSEMTAERMKKSVSLQTEISSPHVSVIQYLSDDELIEIVQQMQHGLGITLWGSDLNKLKQLASQFQVGQIQFNQSMLEWDPCVSFQAQKKSGNHAYHGLKLIEQVTTLKDIG
jgi:acyl-CoA reductase-like NAD-dependent aldehyde dehydrogenase